MYGTCGKYVYVISRAYCTILGVKGIRIEAHNTIFTVQYFTIYRIVYMKAKSKVVKQIPVSSSITSVTLSGALCHSEPNARKSHGYIHSVISITQLMTLLASGLQLKLLPSYLRTASIKYIQYTVFLFAVHVCYVCMYDNA